MAVWFIAMTAEIGFDALYPRSAIATTYPIPAASSLAIPSCLDKIICMNGTYIPSTQMAATKAIYSIIDIARPQI
ncbi:hypothetical protein GCM10009425_45170 [Pseudomonas asuensis]|uniref:Uncharacterized protein n=1 Tax=Pseudomonas asuensis TaxID=1825787 RepID=A0ABQ2H2R5_9PSED|nr:hypothetical protein GCM10009425_45170 [Pseudomonas asuensis]